MADVPLPTGLRPLELERVQSSRADAGQLQLRLSGRWLDPQAEAEEDEELLVVNVEGRRHRFPASREERSDAELAPGRWSASFKIPAWAEPREEGQAALWLGNAVIPVPPLREPVAPSRPGPGAARSASPHAGSQPPADPLLADTIAALRAELEQRTADAVEIRAALAHARSELESRSSSDGELEATLSELRGELDRLRTALHEQRGTLRQRTEQLAELREQVATAQANAELLAELREQVATAQANAELRDAEATTLRGDLAAAHVSREAAASEAAGLRSELERVGSELAVTREQVDTESVHLQDANKLLADARALAEELRAAESGG
jgi:hypothetical protein